MLTGKTAGNEKVRRRADRRAPAMLLGVAGAIVAVAAVAWACGVSDNGALGESAGSPADVAGQPAAGEQQATGVVTTTLGPSGFTPNQLSHAPGKFELKVQNQSGEKQVVLSLSNASGIKLSEVKLSDKVKEWTMPLDLAAGMYTLTEAGHPNWTCSLEVTEP